MLKIIAHRGASAYAPENTFAAFEKARSMGANCIEFDVMLSADGEPFIFHDTMLNRTTNGSGGLGRAHSDYVRTLDAGSWFSENFQSEPVPTLSDVLAWLLQFDMQANIEIKAYPGYVKETTIAVLSALNSSWPHDKPLPLVSSFNREALTLCRTLSPEMPIGMLLHKWEDDWYVTAENLAATTVHLCWKVVTAARVKAILEKKYLVYVYTINSCRQALYLDKLGVNAVFSDYPDLLADYC